MENIDCISLPNDLNINFLYSEYSENCREALNQAMIMLQAVEMPLQKFNTLGCVTKDTYYKIMCHFKKRLNDDPSDKKSTCIALVCLMDTLTCMIKERAFFDEYTNNIKHLLLIIANCMQVLHRFCRTDDLNAEQVEILLNLVQKFVERIKGHEQMDMSIILNINSKINSIKLAHKYKLKGTIRHTNTNQKDKVKISSNNNSAKGPNEGILKDFCSRKNIMNNNNENTLFPVVNGTNNKKINLENPQKKIKDENVKHLGFEKNNKKDITKNNITNNGKSTEKINAFAYMMARSKTAFKKK